MHSTIYLPWYISWGRIQHFELLISPGTHYCWVDRGSMGREVCLTLRHMSNSAPLPVLPPTTLSPLVSHVDVCLATMSQSCLTFALPPLVNHAWLYLATISQTQLTFSLPPLVRINYFIVTTRQTWLSFALPPSVRHGWLSLSPSVRHGWLSLPPSVRHGWLCLATNV